MNKKLHMTNFDNLVTVQVDLDRCLRVACLAEKTRDFSPEVNGITVGLSSGTSGKQGVFLASPNEQLHWSGIMLAKCLPTSILRSMKVALFLRANSNLYKSIGKSKFIQFKFYDLLDEIGKSIIALQKYQPDILVAPASILTIIAKVLREGKISLNLKKVISCAEVLSSESKTYLVKSFGQTIHEIYQCAEGFLGATCQHGVMHLNEDNLIIEKIWLDKSLRKFMPQVTDLSRISQPIIRYQLDDILTERKEPCLCGHPFLAIEKIEGRCDEIWYGSSTKHKSLIMIFPDFISRAILASCKNIEDFYCQQLSPTDCLLAIKSKTYSSSLANAKHAIEQLFSNKLCLKPSIKVIEYVAHTIQILKKKRIKRSFDENLYETA